MSTKPVTSQTCNTQECDDNLPECNLDRNCDLTTIACISEIYAPYYFGGVTTDFEDGHLTLVCIDPTCYYNDIKTDKTKDDYVENVQIKGQCPDSIFNKLMEGRPYVLCDLDVQFNANWSFPDYKIADGGIGTTWDGTSIATNNLKGQKLCIGAAYVEENNLFPNSNWWNIFLDSTIGGSSLKGYRSEVFDHLISNTITDLHFQIGSNYVPTNTDNTYINNILNEYGFNKNHKNNGTPLIKIIIETAQDSGEPYNTSGILTYNFYNNIKQVQLKYLKEKTCRFKTYENMYNQNNCGNEKFYRYKTEVSVKNYTDASTTRSVVNPVLQNWINNGFKGDKENIESTLPYINNNIKKVTISGTGTSMDKTYTP